MLKFSYLHHILNVRRRQRLTFAPIVRDDAAQPHLNCFEFLQTILQKLPFWSEQITFWFPLTFSFQNLSSPTDIQRNRNTPVDALRVWHIVLTASVFWRFFGMCITDRIIGKTVNLTLSPA